MYEANITATKRAIIYKANIIPANNTPTSIIKEIIASAGTIINNPKPHKIFLKISLAFSSYSILSNNLGNITIRTIPANINAKIDNTRSITLFLKLIL